MQLHSKIRPVFIIKVFAAFTLLSVIIIYFFIPQIMIQLGQVSMRCYSNVSRYEKKLGQRNWVYLKGGSGQVVLLIHGYGTNKDRWYPIIGHLTDRLTVIAPDIPGFGETTILQKDSFTINEQTHHLHTFISSFNFKKIHLVGVSMGAAIAGTYASIYPKAIKSLTLISPYGIKTKIKSYANIHYRKKIKDLLLYTDLAHQNAFMQLVLNKKIFIPGSVKSYFLKRRLKNYPKYEKIFNGIYSSGENNLFKHLHKIQATTLAIWGTEDRLFHYSGAKIIKRYIRKSEIVLVKNGSHAMFYDRSKEVTEALLKFLLSSK